MTKNDGSKNPWKGLWSPSTWRIFENVYSEVIYSEPEGEEELEPEERSDSRMPAYWSGSIMGKRRA